ncbi:MAG: GAF domain-containing sensor histidine kinase [Bdellovibrionales bacterium]|nr:GAF domain-containing sensor histidine kinase [Bdellovibrionales bacterium]
MSSTVSSMANTQTIRRGLSSTSLSREQLVFLAKLPSFLNSSLDTTRIIHIALEHVKGMLNVQTAAVYLMGRGGDSLRYWTLSDCEARRIDAEMPFDENSMVGSVIGNKFPLVVKDAATSTFSLATRPDSVERNIKSIICTPLMCKGGECLGAVEMVNRMDGVPFSSDDVVFVEQFGHQVALALDNARLFRESQERSEMLARLDKRKSEMISIIAHEFLTPITLIQGSAELVAMKQGQTSENLEILAMLQNGVERLKKLIKQVKSVAMLQDGSIAICPSQIDLHHELQVVEAMFKSTAAERQMTLEIELEESARQIEADAGLLVLALQNLVSNAFRCTPDGGKITVGACKRNGVVELRVADTGIGIEASELPFIFEKFYEVGDVDNHSSGDNNFGAKGLGLGLAAVRHIVEAHGGKIHVKSEVDKGSVFSLQLPTGDK